MVKKKSKHRNTADRSHEEVVFKEDDQYYAVATKSLGAGRFELACDDGTTRLGKLRGNMRRSQWVSAGSVVLISLRDFGSADDDTKQCKADILLKYSDTAIKQLRRYGELDWMRDAAHTSDAEDEETIVFEENGDQPLDLSLV
jgi:translation initiation factor 1A